MLVQRERIDRQQNDTGKLGEKPWTRRDTFRSDEKMHSAALDLERISR